MIATKKRSKVPRLGSNSSKERKKLIKACDELVSLIVRKRDKFCVDCGTTERLTCSHLIKRGRAATRFDLRNCNCHCSSHNFRHNSYPEIYIQWFIKKYGLDTYNELVELSRQPKKWTLDELRALKSELKENYDSILSEL